MSIGKLSEAANLGEDFKGLTPEQVKEKILGQFHVTYGRYENVSGTMWFEMCHEQDPEKAGQVHWRKGVGVEVTEDEILTREQAIKRFIAAQQKGYQRVSEALTEEDLIRARERTDAERSALDREGLLAVFRKGKEYISVKEYNRGRYSIERGYDTSVFEAQHDQSETAVRVALNFAEAEGFVKEGTEAVEAEGNPMKWFNLEDAPAQAAENAPAPEEIEEGAFNPKWFQ